MRKLACLWVWVVVCLLQNAAHAGPHDALAARAKGVGKKFRHTEGWKPPEDVKTPAWADAFLDQCRDPKEWTQDYQCGSFAATLQSCIKKKFPGRTAVHVRITGCYDKDFAPERFHQHQMVIVRETCTDDEERRGVPREYAAISSQPGGGGKGYTACRWYQTCGSRDTGPRVPVRCYDALCGSEAQRPELFLYH